MTRLRELGITPGYLPVGRHNAITDVRGVRVGHTTLIQDADGSAIRTGTTAILPHDGDIFREKPAAAVYTLNGFGKAAGFEQVREFGRIETPIVLTNTLNVGLVWDAVVAYMLRQHADIGLTAGTVNPVVGECNDGYLNDIRGRHVRQEHVWSAIETATDGAVVEGCVGAGTGTTCYSLKGGIGTASRVIGDGQYTVGALVQTNFGRLPELMVCGVPVGQHIYSQAIPPSDPGSVMMIIATDAPCDSRQLGRLAKRAAFGLARTGTVCHDGSGDFVIAFSTTNRWQHATDEWVQSVPRLTEMGQVMDMFFAAVVESIEEAVLNSLIAAETITGRDGNTRHALDHAALLDIMRRYRRI